MEAGACIQRTGARIAREHRQREVLAAVAARPPARVIKQCVAEALAFVLQNYRKIRNVAAKRVGKKVALQLQPQEPAAGTVRGFADEAVLARCRRAQRAREVGARRRNDRAWLPAGRQVERHEAGYQ